MTCADEAPTNGLLTNKLCGLVDANPVDANSVDANPVDANTCTWHEAPRMLLSGGTSWAFPRPLTTIVAVGCTRWAP